jgi:hypothetical protein
MNLMQGVQSQALYCNTPYRRPPMNLRSLRIEQEMVFPLILTRMKKLNLLRFNLIPTSNCIGLEDIAGVTGQGQIFRGIIYASCFRGDMLYLKNEVKDLLWGTTVFTTVSGAGCNIRIKGIHDFTR